MRRRDCRPVSLSMRVVQGVGTWAAEQIALSRDRLTRISEGATSRPA